MRAGLTKSIPTERLRRYLLVANSHGVDPIDIYLWNIKLSLALFEDIQYLEVAMRSAIARELTNTYGLNWYDNHQILDSPTLNEIGQIKKRTRNQQSSPIETHGRIVAGITFGFWVKLLGKGGHLNTYDPKTRILVNSQRRIFDQTLWQPAISKAFTNKGNLRRSSIESLARTIQNARNRVAHHEHIIWGIPIVGQTTGGIARRVSLGAIHKNLLELSSTIEPDLETWIISNSSVNQVITQNPLGTTASLLI